MTQHSKSITVGDTKIKKGNCFIIADVGSNHMQDLNLALETIDAAAENGAHAVKFQSLDIEKLYFDPTEDIKSLYSKIYLNEEWYHQLNERCNQRGVHFFSSPTYMDSIEALEKLDAKIYKLASAQIGTFPQIIQKVAELKKPTIFSTGLVSYGELENAVKIFEKNKNDDYIILHCNAIYPTTPDRVNLERMLIYEKMFNCLVGFSDHTLGNYCSFAAVAKGATVIERHFTSSNSVKSPDMVVSINPDQLRDLSRGIADIQKSLVTQPRLTIETEELSFKKSLTYRIVFNRALKTGDKIKLQDLKFLRHTEGVDCKDLDFILSKNARVNADKLSGELLNWADLKFE